MRTTELTPRQERRRRAMLLLPLIILPFLTLLFWAAGGGRGAAAPATETAGLNTQLPKALLATDPDADKLSFYDQAQRDSLAKVAALKKDPYAPKTDSVPVTANEALVYEKLAALQTAVNKPATVTSAPPVYQPAVMPPKAEDPELKQMSALLEKVLEIQHPERLTAKADTLARPVERFRAIPAIIDGKQKITSGSVIKIRLTDTVTLNGQYFEKGQSVYGSGNFYNQRLLLRIRTIRVGYQICPVDLTVYDLQDGLEGISVPEALTDDALKSGSTNAIDNMQVMSMDPSVAGQAATAGINAAKGLFSKKVKRIKARLDDGHGLLLRNNERHEH